MTSHRYSAPHEYVSPDADLADRLEQQARNELYMANEIDHEHVLDDRNGGLATCAQLDYLMQDLAADIRAEETAGSKRHWKLSRRAKYLAKGSVLLDFLLLLWFASSIFNVDWDNDPVGVPLAASLGFTLFGTVVAVFVLDKAGRVARDHKNDERHLTWSEVNGGIKAFLGLATAITVGLAASIAVRIYIEGRYSGDPDTALLFAVPIGLVLLAANAWVCWSAFLDGSKDRDDLEAYGKRLAPLFKRQLQHRRKSQKLQEQVRLLRRRAQRTAAPTRTNLVRLDSYPAPTTTAQIAPARDDRSD